MENKLIKKKFILCVLLCVLPSISFASLASYSTTTPITGVSTEWPNNPPSNPPLTLSFPQFDPSLGTLNSVTLEFNGSMNTVLTIINSSPEASSGNAMTELQMTIQDSGNNLNAPQIDLFSSLYGYSLIGGGSITSGTLTKIGTSSNTYTLAAVLAEFTGTGNIALDATTFTQTWIMNNGGNTSAQQVTDASLTGTVIYDYTVPEPATMSILSIGGLALLKKRKK